MKLETRSITHGWVGTPKAGVGDREMRIVTDSVGGWECFSLESVGGGGGGQPCEPPKTREERWGGEISLEMKKRSSGGGGEWGVRMALSARRRRCARGLGDGAAAIHMCRVDHLNGSDVFFFVSGETFHAHRALLAACSPVFKALLLGGDSGEDTGLCQDVRLLGVEEQVSRLLLGEEEYQSIGHTWLLLALA